MKSMSLGAVIGTVVSVFAVSILLGILVGNIIKNKRELPDEVQIDNVTSIPETLNQGIKRVKQDPSLTPTIDAEHIKVRKVVGLKEYHYTLSGVVVEIQGEKAVEVYLKNSENNSVLKADFQSRTSTWSFDDIPATDSGVYAIYARNVTDGVDSDVVLLDKFKTLNKVKTPSEEQLEAMYKSGDYEKLDKYFNPNFKFSFTNISSNEMKPSTNREVCTRLHINAWDNLKVTDIETDCLGYIYRIKIEVIKYTTVLLN